MIDTYPKDEYDEPSLAGQMLFSENEERIFVTNRGHDSLALFNRDLETGLLTYQEFVDTSANPRDIAIFKDRWIVSLPKRWSS
ncbi:MAG: beta-propeller fold lactonase family protein [Thomasclavelia sp.]